MNNSIYTDKQLVDLANKEYDPDNKVGGRVFIDRGQTFIGHISEVNHKAWGNLQFEN